MTLCAIIRNAKRAEEAWLERNQQQRCVICRRWFIKREGTVCSIDCLMTLKEQQQRSSAKAENG